ncbi:MAG: alpha/beta fold hydrolase [Paracoccaceae bacterium]
MQSVDILCIGAMIYNFASCSLDTARHILSRDGQPVHVEPQVFDLLTLLAENPGELITTERLIKQVWGGLNVSDSTISARIHAARSAVGDSGKRQNVIQTVPRRGFRLAAPVTVAQTDNDKSSPPEISPQRQDIRYARSSDGLKLAYACSGAGPPLVRVGHWLTHLEFDWSSPVWQPFLHALGTRHRLVRYDQRGTGLSERQFAGRGIEEFVDDLQAVVRANNLRRFPLLASSQAVPVAVRFAAQYPEQVSKLILFGGYVQGRALRDKAANDVEEEMMLGLIRAGWGVHGSPFMKSFSALFAPDATPEQLADMANIQLHSASAETAVRLRRLVDRFDVSEYARQVRAPTLVMHANGDVVHPFEQGQLLASEISDARFVALDSQNHIPLPQHKSWPVMIDKILHFLAEPDI